MNPDPIGHPSGSVNWIGEGQDYFSLVLIVDVVFTMDKGIKWSSSPTNRAMNRTIATDLQLLLLMYLAIQGKSSFIFGKE